MVTQRYIEMNSEELTNIAEVWAKKHSPTFEELSASILQTHKNGPDGGFACS